VQGNGSRWGSLSVSEEWTLWLGMFERNMGDFEKETVKRGRGKSV
jgi:hypothetical protein